jgi:hypothetical protein
MHDCCKLLENRFDAFFYSSLLLAEPFAGFAVKDDGDITLFFADGFLADEEFAKPLKTSRWSVLFEDDLVISADRRVTDFESW